MQIFEQTATTRFEGEIGTVERLSERIIEIQITHGMEVGRKEAEAVQRCIRTLTGGVPAALLIDRRSSHALSFEAQKVVAADRKLVAVAFLAASSANQIVVDYSKSTYFKHVPVQNFTEHERAIAWLEKAVEAPELV